MSGSALLASPTSHDSTLPTSATLRGAGGIDFPMTFMVSSQDQEGERFNLQGRAPHRFTVTWSTTWLGKTSLMLHSASANMRDPPIASIEIANPWTNTSVMQLPGGVCEKLQSRSKLPSSTFSFVIPIPQAGGTTYPEKFEWRQSRGTEVRGLSSSRAWGYKLIRLSKDSPMGDGGKRKERRTGEASDGKEVVAVWADCVRTYDSKLGCFQFCGSGATGELGEEWTLMAVLSAFRLWQSLGAGMIRGYG